MLSARLLGGFELTVDGAALRVDSFERPTGLRLLKLLLATPGHHIRREAAADALWPEADADTSRASLRKALHFARKALAAAGVAEETGARLADYDTALGVAGVDQGVAW